MGITDFCFSFCCEKVGSKLLGVECSSLLFCFTEEYTFLCFQVIFCFLFNYHTEVNLFSFSWGNGDSIHLRLVLVNKLFMCRIFPCSVVRYHCSGSLLLAWAVCYISHNNMLNDLFWKIRSTWFGKKCELHQRQGSRRGLPLVWGAGYVKEDPAWLHGSTMWGRRTWCNSEVLVLEGCRFLICTREWLNLKGFRSDAKLVFSFQLIKTPDLCKEKITYWSVT